MSIQEYINSYTEWLRSEITFSKVGEYYEINTPFLDNDNDYLQFYVKQEKDEVYFTDDGFTINSLEMTGVSLTPTRKNQLSSILQQFGVQLDKKELVLKAPASQFAQKKHAFTQCLMRVSDMCMISKSKAGSYFLEDIQTFFQENDIFCMENVQFTGKSGFYHNYDFAIQRSKFQPERLCLAINSPTKASMSNALFAWGDTKPSRKPDSKLIVLLNDTSKIGKGIVEGFENYGVSSIRWSERSHPENLRLLSA